MPTPVRSEILTGYINGYVDSEVNFLVSGFQSGFSVPISYRLEPRSCPNHPSSLKNKHIVSQKLSQELEAGRIVGPFDNRPDDLVCSPLALIPKKEPGQFRLIQDLSYPKHSSVNTAIDKEHTQVVYDSIDTIVEKVKHMGRHCLLAKTDIENAFRIIPIRPADRHLLGFSWPADDGTVRYYMDACLVMGLSSSCQLFNRFSSALTWVMETKYNACVSHVLDDFCFLGRSSSNQCFSALNSFLDMCNDIGVPIKHEKTTAPSTEIVIYGIEIDSSAMLMRLPADKVEKIRCELQSILKRKKVTLKYLQSIIGLLNFATSCIVPGRCFLRRLYDLTIGVTCPSFYIRLSCEARADFHMWHTFITSFNGKCLFLNDSWVSSDTLKLFTDAASTVGFAAVFGKQWFAQKWPISFQAHKYHINILELFPIVLAIQIWGHKMANHKIVISSDNATTVHVINNMTSKDKVMMRLVRRLVLLSLQHNILFRATHVPGHSNIIADRLSRLQFQEALQQAPYLDKVPISLPTELLTV